MRFHGSSIPKVDVYRQQATTRLQEDYGKTTGRALCVSGPVLLETMERFRETSAKPPRSPREASAKPPRSHRGPTSMLRHFEAQPCPLVLKLNYSLAAFHRPLSHGLNLIQQHGSANVRDVCGTSIREARRSHSAKPQSCREASRSQPFHKFWPREAPRVASPAVYTKKQGSVGIP